MVKYEETLSQTNLKKLRILKELIPNYLKSQTAKETAYTYNDLFDKFYEKDTGELIVLNKIYKS